MNKSLLKCIGIAVGIASITISLAGCGETPAQYNLGHNFTLRAGQSAQIAAEDLTLTFDKLLNDSRCPAGATCIWEGQAQCLVTIDLKSKKEQITLTQPGSAESTTQIYDGYVISFNVTPYPKVNETNPPAMYRLNLNITKES